MTSTTSMSTKHVTRAVTLVGVAALAVTTAACSSSKAKTSTGSSTTTSTTSSAASSSAATTDYTKLLLSVGDIPVDGITEGTPSPLPQGTGATVSFIDASTSRKLGDTVVVFQDAAAAATAAQASLTAAKQSITSAKTAASTIGSNGNTVSGTNAQGAATILIFTEGRAEIVLEFDSPANDPVPDSVLTPIGTRQDAIVKAGLPS